MKSNLLKRRNLKVGIFCLLLVFVCLSACAKEDGNVSILESVKEYKGYERQISKEEYELYAYFADREMEGNLTKQEQEEKIMEYAKRANAVFYLANKWNLCEPFSYEVLKFRLEQENESRKIKKEKGEAIYGLEQFTIEQFFQYKLGTAEADLRSYLEAQSGDRTVVGEAKKYYEENKDYFKVREKVVYEVTIAKQTETVEADRTQINFLGKSDPGLADFLEYGMEGDSYTDLQGEGERQVVLKEISYSEAGFEKNKEAAVMVYINQKLYPQLIAEMAKNITIQP